MASTEDNSVKMPEESREDTVFEKLQKSYIEMGSYLSAREPEFLKKIKWDRNGSEEVLVDAESFERKEPVEMELIMVAEISSNHFFMTSDGGYTGKGFGTGYTPQFGDVKASCVLTAPRSEPWRTDFDNALTNLRVLEQQKARLTSGTQHQGLFKDDKKTMPKIVHKLFTKRAGLSENEQEEVAAITEPSLMIENWPVPDNNKNNLENIKETHIVCVIPAYDCNNKLIKPEEYRQKLAGAIVECHFSISHWFFEREKNNLFNAVTRKFKIIENPRPPPASPRKRQIFINLDGESSPKKKRLD